MPKKIQTRRPGAQPIGDDAPATKGDLKAFATKEDLKAFATKEDLKEVDAKVNTLDANVNTLDAKLNRVVVEVANLKGEVGEIRHTMATQMATKDDIRQILNAIDRFASRSEEDMKSRLIHGQALTEHAVTMKDHEGRIVKLETAQ